jgi:hypothetical protein
VFHAGLKDAAQPVAMEYDVIAPLCVALSVLQHHNLLTPRDSVALLRHICFHVPTALDAALWGEGRRSTGARVGSPAPGQRGVDDSQGASPRAGRADLQFASPGVSRYHAADQCFMLLCKHNAQMQLVCRAAAPRRHLQGFNENILLVCVCV